ncbi:MAG: superoxide dismutase [Planctomycetota bacterium]
MAYELTALPYPYDALEPHIDTRTMEIHHTKHHAAYITNVNKALEGHPALAGRPIEKVLRDIQSVPESIRQTVVNHGGGHANHNLFWKIMAPHKGGQPKGRLADEIKKVFGGFEPMKEQFTTAAMSRFGSGWAWLGLDANGKLHVGSTANQDSPLMHGHTPLLGLDVWEHAYYLKYQNRRADYVTAWWNVVNWDMVSELYEATR